MFSIRQKREIADNVQKILRAVDHPPLLPKGEIQFTLIVVGTEPWSRTVIRNNGAVENPNVNPWNELQDKTSAESFIAEAKEER